MADKHKTMQPVTTAAAAIEINQVMLDVLCWCVCTYVSRFFLRAVFLRDARRHTYLHSNR